MAILCALCCRPASYQGPPVAYERMRTNASIPDFVLIGGRARRICSPCDREYGLGYGIDVIRYRHLQQCLPCREVFAVLMDLSMSIVDAFLVRRCGEDPFDASY